MATQTGPVHFISSVFKASHSSGEVLRSGEMPAGGIPRHGASQSLSDRLG